jgi:hypothetical protein
MVENKLFVFGTYGYTKLEETFGAHKLKKGRRNTERAINVVMKALR